MAHNDATTSHDRAWQTLAEFTLTGEPGSESLAVAGVVQAVHDLHLPSAQLERLKAIVAEAVLNATRRCNDLSQPGASVAIHVRASNANVTSRQGWGFFLIERAINDARTMGGRACYLIEVFLYLEGWTSEKT
ncbi:MAG: hypothetical protein ACRDGG_00275 [Anaerolineae bacterium]